MFGVFEILSSRPNAFVQGDLYNLQALTDLILENRRREWEATATLPHKASGSFLHNLEKVVPRDNSHASESDRIPRGELRERASRRTDILTPILGVLVLGAAVLLGILVCSRLGWHLDLRRSSPPHRANGPSKIGRTDHNVPPAKELLTGSAPAAEPGADGPVPRQRIPAGTERSAQPPSDRLTGNQDSGIIVMPPFTPSPTRDSPISQRSPGFRRRSRTAVRGCPLPTERTCIELRLRI